MSNGISANWLMKARFLELFRTTGAVADRPPVEQSARIRHVRRHDVDDRGHDLLRVVGDVVGRRVHGGQVAQGLFEHLLAGHLDEGLPDEVTFSSRVEAVDPEHTLVRLLGGVVRLVVHHDREQGLGVDPGVEGVARFLLGDASDLVEQVAAVGGDGEAQPFALRPVAEELVGVAQRGEALGGLLPERRARA
jgi:hypothetical protein